MEDYTTLQTEYNVLRYAYEHLLEDKHELEKALYDACSLIVENSIELDECLLKNQKFCRDCPLEDCDVTYNWYKYFLENARHPPE